MHCHTLQVYREITGWMEHVTVQDKTLSLSNTYKSV